jgi:hypothetical protein
VFIHNPRTGGAFVKTLFKEYLPLTCFAALEDYHLPISQVPAEFKDKMSFGLIRNPWSWYVSLYHFQQPCGKWLRLTKAKTFHDFVKTFLSDEFIQENRHKKFYPVGNPHLPPIVPKFEYIDNLTVGFYTYRYIYMFFNNYKEIFASKDLQGFKKKHDELLSVDHILRIEDLPNNIINLLAKNGTPVPLEVIPKWRGAPKKNHTHHKGYRELYTDHLIDLVAKKDSLIIENYGYEFL